MRVTSLQLTGFRSFVDMAPINLDQINVLIGANNSGGRAVLSTEAADLALCADARRTPALVIRLSVASVYLHCAKAFMRSQLWDTQGHVDRAQMPSMGEMLRDQIQAFTGEEMVAETQAQMLERYQQSL